MQPNEATRRDDTSLMCTHGSDVSPRYDGNGPMQKYNSGQLKSLNVVGAGQWQRKRLEVSPMSVESRGHMKTSEQNSLSDAPQINGPSGSHIEIMTCHDKGKDGAGQWQVKPLEWSPVSVNVRGQMKTSEVNQRSDAPMVEAMPPHNLPPPAHARRRHAGSKPTTRSLEQGYAGIHRPGSNCTTSQFLKKGLFRTNRCKSKPIFLGTTPRGLPHQRAAGSARPLRSITLPQGVRFGAWPLSSLAARNTSCPLSPLASIVRGIGTGVTGRQLCAADATPWGYKWDYKLVGIDKSNNAPADCGCNQNYPNRPCADAQATTHGEIIHASRREGGSIRNRLPFEQQRGNADATDCKLMLPWDRDLAKHSSQKEHMQQMQYNANKYVRMQPDANTPTHNYINHLSHQCHCPGYNDVHGDYGDNVQSHCTGKNTMRRCNIERKASGMCDALTITQLHMLGPK